MTVVLGIETSCDETAAAVVANGNLVLSSVVSSQIDLHARYGGVVPEVASRAHLDLVLPVVAEALKGAQLDPLHPGIDAVAVTYGPGLVGALLVGVSAAKALAMGWKVPVVGVNHLEGHLYAALLDGAEMEMPVIVELVSGGHTLLIEVQGPGRYRVLGSTLDDAAGEAFDKVARHLGLGYPGGSEIERLARSGSPDAVALPRPMLGNGLDMSFSGLKTAVVQYLNANPDISSEDVAASFQAAVVQVLVGKAMAAVRQIGGHGVCLAGGVAANGALRQAMSDACKANGLAVYLPSRSMCTDNAAMIAAAGHFRLKVDGPSSLGLGAEASLAFPKSLDMDSFPA